MLMGDELARNSQMYVGYHGHVQTFPIEKGEIMNVGAFRTRREMERRELGIADTEKDMKWAFVEWGDSVKEILSLTEKPNIWALFDHPPADTYYKGDLCLLGESAHGSAQDNSAGVGMALEDAYKLSNLLGSAQKMPEVEEAFKAYDARKRHRTQKLVTESRDAGKVYDLEGDGVGIYL